MLLLSWVFSLFAAIAKRPCVSRPWCVFRNCRLVLSLTVCSRAACSRCAPVISTPVQCTELHCVQGVRVASSADNIACVHILLPFGNMRLFPVTLCNEIHMCQWSKSLHSDTLVWNETGLFGFFAMNYIHQMLLQHLQVFVFLDCSSIDLTLTKIPYNCLLRPILKYICMNIHIFWVTKPGGRYQLVLCYRCYCLK